MDTTIKMDDLEGKPTIFGNIHVVRCGVDGGMVVDFLEMCLSHGMGKEAELKDLIKTIQSYWYRNAWFAKKHPALESWIQ